MKILYFSLFAILVLPSCQDYLDVSSASKFESDFVFQSDYEADKAVLGAYELLKSEVQLCESGIFYELTTTNSDIEVGCEIPAFGYYYNQQNCYNQAPQLSTMPNGSWDAMYKTINRCNIIIDAFDNNESFILADKTKPSRLTHLYGEVVAIRATMYYELTSWWGDVIYFTKPITEKSDYVDAKLTDRSIVQEEEIAKLIEVEPMMYHLKSQGVSTVATRMTKEYVEGLIARLALIRGGFALRPADYSGDGEVIQSHPEWGKMVRNTDWKDYYQIANTYLKKLVYEGNAHLEASDPRTPVEKFSNPFQYFFQQGMDYAISPESVFEVSVKSGTRSGRPYAFGRPSDGPSSGGYPPRAYGQVRFFPTYYYGMFNPTDLRRDVTVAITALGGVANEKMISLKKGSGSRGGLAINKWDYSRMTDKTYALNRRETGINAPYMRMGDMILLLAETYSVLGDDGNAKAELLKIRERAFNPNDPDYAANTSGYVNSLGGESLLQAIQDERALELGGEGLRKLDLVRWGIFGQKINDLQSEMTAMISDLESQGYHEFENGNVISNYIYTKTVKKEDSGLNDLLTTTTYVDENDPLYPLLYPGWRGTFTDWETSRVLQNSMIAIKGLFEPLGEIEIAELIADGYVKTEWGINLVDETWKVNVNGVFGGYLPADYAANYPPRYLVGIPASTILTSAGNVSNSYGFPNE